MQVIARHAAHRADARGVITSYSIHYTKLYDDSRIPPEVRGQRDFLVEELQRRAEKYRS